MSSPHAKEVPIPSPSEPNGEEPSVVGLGHSDEKARQILDGAREVFLRDGFDAASMNDIARVAGVSKGTLYAYFQSKDQLFAELIRWDKRQQAERGCLWADHDGETLADTLDHIGRRLIALLSRPDHIAQVRTVMAVAPKFPAIGRAFYEAGPQFGTARLTALLDRHVAAGDLVATDTAMAATQFLHACKADILTRLMFCAGEPATEEEIATTVSSAVRMFLAAYGRR